MAENNRASVIESRVRVLLRSLACLVAALQFAGCPSPHCNRSEGAGAARGELAARSTPPSGDAISPDAQRTTPPLGERPPEARTTDAASGTAAQASLRGLAREIDANLEGATREDADVACRGGEVSVTWSRLIRESRVLKAELVFAAAGHFSWRYEFYYRDGAAFAARLRASAWSFAGGTPDEPRTKEKVLERWYEYGAGSRADCVERRAAGPSERIDALLEAATQVTIDCVRATDIAELAMQAQAQPEATSWLLEACRHDPSIRLKL